MRTQSGDHGTARRAHTQHTNIHIHVRAEAVVELASVLLCVWLCVRPCASD